ncbi:RsmB/NOP family class I SAM-dependent RNA methyltransferase [Mesobacterium pallidum]|uniref:RsmB/NOP family class I SAM-dependent RNA methyltransferase n=1 Tax=Mesobacterium pallidum TaxID=2872037 RepID=UPI001EE188D8|nr:RsmB/NOP family class I SAM-dependent RNA methyltransferase [Mesobacterium pallidum]
MTPGARIAAAMEVLDEILDGTAAEPALKGWARGHRFAGSKDRAAIRDHVFDALRMLASSAALGGARTGRGVMIGLLRQQGADLDTLLNGAGHAPAPVETWETGEIATRADRLDLPEWLLADWDDSLGDEADAVAEALRARAPVFLRANLGKTDRDTARAALAREEIETEIATLSQTALRVTEGARAIAQSQAYADGLVELQDAASQAVVARLELTPGAHVLDYCAGGGGKALALAARGAKVDVHDAEPRRMVDIPARAARAGVTLRQVETPAPGYEIVVADAPCSGSGSWRRDPQGKWRLTPADLDRLNAVQDMILSQIQSLAPRIAYVTCSVLRRENGDRVAAFLAAHPGWRLEQEHQFLPGPEGDGFYMAQLTRV